VLGVGVRDIAPQAEASFGFVFVGAHHTAFVFGSALGVMGCKSGEHNCDLSDGVCGDSCAPLFVGRGGNQ